MIDRLKKIKNSIPWPALLLIMVTILISNVGGNILSDLFDLLKLPIWLQIIIIIPIVYILLIISYQERGKLFPFKMLSKHICEPHKGLIILLSDCNCSIENKCFPLKITKVDKDDKDNITKVIEKNIKGESLEDDIKAVDGIKWNWQQLLRGLLPHIKSLEIAYLIGSKDTCDDSGKLIKKGSHNDINNAHLIISKYFPEIREIKMLEKQIDFEDFDELIKYINKSIIYIKNTGIDEKDIIIDVTGGMKTTSIAGAVVTMNKKVKFQYVQTFVPFKTIAYDVKTVPEIPQGD